MKKITIFFSAILLCLFIFVGLSYASSDNLPTLPDFTEYGDHYYYIFENYTNDIFMNVFYLESDSIHTIDHFRIYRKATGDIVFYLKDGYSIPEYMLATYKITDNQWECVYNGFVDGGTTVSASSLIQILYSNVDITNESGTSVFFPQTPLVVETPVEEKQEITLAPIVEKVEAEKTLAEVVGILPLIIVVVVSLVGLRKALKMLLAVLHRA